MSLRVAITRAQPDAMRTAARVRELGAEPVIAPLLAVGPIAFDPDTSQAQALLFSSANGVRAFAGASAERRLPVLAVGDATAAEARALGFANVKSADGDAAALAMLAIATLRPAAGKVLHISGAQVAADIAAELAAAGFTAERRIAYEAVAAAQLPEVFFSTDLDIVLFHSARAAETFANLEAPNADRLIAACLSPAVALSASISRQKRITWKRIVVAEHPREEALLQAALASTGASA